MVQPADAVARIQSITGLGSASEAFGYAKGKFYPIRTYGEGPHVKAANVPAIVLRGGKEANFAVADVNMPLQVGDVVRTGPSTMVGIEFLIGGRVSVNTSTCVEIVNERSVADGWNGYKRTFLKNTSLWFKADAKALKQPIEIQTNGGVMGTKG